ncbi:hypothetical protein V7S43_007263 [Phytophthora oleae]|uniref:Uncharacterized protein n=1 Tax=Phytophthora oleae TaxID=2107226 RepID=A0ABD3FLC6_9STRA
MVSREKARARTLKHEELPPHPGSEKQRKAHAREALALSRQQQAEANRVKIRAERRLVQEDEAISSRRLPPAQTNVRHGGKKLTPYQERVLAQMYPEYAGNKPRSSSVDSIELGGVLVELKERFDNVAHGRKKPHVQAVRAQVDSAVKRGASAVDDNTIERNGVGDTENPPKTFQNHEGTLADAQPVEDAPAEVLQQFDEQDELRSHGDSDDGEYVEERDVVKRLCPAVPSSRTSLRTKRAPKSHQRSSKRSVQAPEVSASELESELPVSAVFKPFEEATFQLFSCRTSTSVTARNKQIAAAQKKIIKRKDMKQDVTGGALFPESWCKYSKTFLCTHAIPFEKKGSGQRDHKWVRSTGCTARVNIRLTSRPSGDG